MKKIAIFASGAGSNAAKIVDHFKNHKKITVSLIVTNKADAGVLTIAAQNGIASLILEKEKFFRGNAFTDELKDAGIDFIILAGFLWKIPTALIKEFPDRIINIHPALLPNYGGKGMYGQHVHQSVIDNKETETGITIHFVDEQYDHGDIIFQAKCSIQENDTALSLAAKVQQLEHEHYPLVIEKILVRSVN
ncbi:MAG: phosphoribosylglycinamide formyltransferase [Chitinophagaceae bacterium]